MTRVSFNPALVNAFAGSKPFREPMRIGEISGSAGAGAAALPVRGGNGAGHQCKL